MQAFRSRLWPLASRSFSKSPTSKFATMTDRTPIQVLQTAWKRIAPLELADNSWDNVGVMIEAPFPNPNAKKVLLTIDLTTDVCKEAMELEGCSLVVSYHPPIFRGLKSLTLADPLQKSLLTLSSLGISVFSPHTSLDAIVGGINDHMAKAFDVASSSAIEPKNDEGAGMGRLVNLKAPIQLSEAVERVKKHFNLDHVLVASNSKPISTVAICAGSGGSLFRGVSADLYLTGELSHHEVLAFRNKSSVILCNHSNTERPYLKTLKETLTQELSQEESGWEVFVSEKDADPLIVM